MAVLAGSVRVPSGQSMPSWVGGDLLEEEARKGEEVHGQEEELWIRLGCDSPLRCRVLGRDNAVSSDVSRTQSWGIVSGGGRREGRRVRCHSRINGHRGGVGGRQRRSTMEPQIPSQTPLSM